MEARLNEEGGDLLQALEASVERLKKDETFEVGDEQARLLDRMVAEIANLKQAKQHTEQERVDSRAKHEDAKQELVKLRRENSALKHKVAEEHAQLQKVGAEKARLEQEREEDLERLYNMGYAVSASNPDASTPIFSYVRNRSNSVSSQESSKSGGGGQRWRSTSCSSPTTYSEDPLSRASTRSSTRSSTPYEKRQK